MGRDSGNEEIIARLAARSPVLTDRWVEVGAAVEEIETAARRLRQCLRSSEASSRPAHADDSINVVVDLLEFFDHLGHHCEEAAAALLEIAGASENALPEQDAGTPVGSLSVARRSSVA